MARGQITAGLVTRDGLDDSTVTPTTGDPTNGHYVANTGLTTVVVTNTNGASTSHTVTWNLVGSKDGQGIKPRTKVIPAGKTYRFGPFPTDAYGGQLNIDVDHAELTLKAYTLVP